MSAFICCKNSASPHLCGLFLLENQFLILRADFNFVAPPSRMLRRDMPSLKTPSSRCSDSGLRMCSCTALFGLAAFLNQRTSAFYQRFKFWWLCASALKSFCVGYQLDKISLQLLNPPAVKWFSKLAESFVWRGNRSGLLLSVLVLTIRHPLRRKRSLAFWFHPPSR